MRTLLRRSLILAAGYYTLALAGCIKNQCNCKVPQTGSFRYKSVSAANLRYSFPTDSLFSVSTFSGDTAAKTRYGIRFSFHYEQTALQKCTRPGYGLLNVAYACSCVEDHFSAKDTVKKMSIRTLSDFDVTHGAGTDVTDYFNTVFLNNSNGVSLTYDKAFAESYYDFNNQYTGSGIKEYDLYLKTAPADSRLAAFELIIEYTNGTTLSARSKPVFLK